MPICIGIRHKPNSWVFVLRISAKFLESTILGIRHWTFYRHTGVTVSETLFLALYKSGIWGLHHSQGHVQPPRLSHPDLWLSADPDNLRIDFQSVSCSKATPYSIFLFSVSETATPVIQSFIKTDKRWRHWFSELEYRIFCDV